VSYLDSSGIGELTAHTACKRNGGALKLMSRHQPHPKSARALAVKNPERTFMAKAACVSRSPSVDMRI
jgi:hypothetical protein